MRPSIIISLCAFNGIIACGLLWYTFGRNQDLPNQTVIENSNSATESMSKTQLWDKAVASGNANEAIYYLKLIDDHDYITEQSEQRLVDLNIGEAPPFAQWPVEQAVIQFYAAKVTSAERLFLVGKIAGRKSLPLSIRDSAFRSLVENSARFSNVSDLNQMVYSLIDSMYSETNSLSETSLQAEHFLSQKGAEQGERDALFQNRLIESLKNKAEPVSKRITALNILAAKGIGQSVAIDRIYEESDIQLQTALLQSMLQSTDTKQYDWLLQVSPSTVEQEQLIQRIILK